MQVLGIKVLIQVNTWQHKMIIPIRARYPTLQALRMRTQCWPSLGREKCALHIPTLPILRIDTSIHVGRVHGFIGRDTHIVE